MFRAIAILGLTGPSGLYRCPFCAGTIHDHLSNTIKDFPLRSIQGMVKQQTAFTESGAIKSKVNLFQNCHSKCLLQGECNVSFIFLWDWGKPL